jgi:predicted DsbA family dithiol-disulfide isomerase
MSKTHAADVFGGLKLSLGLGLLAGLCLAIPGCPKGEPGGKGAEGAVAGPKQTVAEKAKVEFYVMSQCPFGLQVEQGIAPVMEKMGGDVELTIDFIGNEVNGKLTAMHGETEVKGNMVQLCAIKHAPVKSLQFINCMNENMKAIPGNWEACAQRLGLDLPKMKACYEGPEGTDLLKASYAKAQARQARGSPTIYIGNKSYQGPRSELAFSRAICDAFPKDKPALCASLPPPVKVPITIVTDKRCPECRAELWKGRLEGMFPGSEFTVKEYTEPEGKKFYTDLGLSLLPAILFGTEVEKTDNYERVKRFLQPKGAYLEFRAGAKFDPTKEICDNKIDDTGNGKVDCDDPDCKEALVCRKEMPKRLDVFVMSMCPFGVKALNAMEEVLKNFEGELDFHANYIATAEGDGFRALHGQPEVDENIRQLCAIKAYKKNHKYMDYILCRNKNYKSPNWQECTGANGIDAGTIEKCFNGEGKQLLRDNLKIAEGLGIGASPTWLANNKFQFSGIAAEPIKQQVCKYNQGMKNCDKTLSGPEASGAPAGACK